MPPVNIGPRSTPNYDALARGRRAPTVGNRKFFAGQRDDPFFVDLGSIFDLGGLRPFNTLHVLPLPTAAGVDGVSGYNTHSIVLQVPITDLTRNHQHADRADRSERRDRHLRLGRRASRSASSMTTAPSSCAASGPDFAPGQAAGQRSDHPGGQEGPLERPRPAG